MAKRPSPIYPATVLRHVDGDTLDVEVTLYPLRPTLESVWDLRVLGINCREHDQPGGPEATAYLASLAPVGSMVAVQLVKPDKYGGRTLAIITLPSGEDLASRMITDGWAAPWNGRGKKPVPPWPRIAPQSSPSADSPTLS